MTFRIYSAEGLIRIPLWSETQEVTLEHGLFSVALGAENPFDADLFDGQRLLGIQVADDPEMQPRQLISYSPRAINSDRFAGREVDEFFIKNKSNLKQYSNSQTAENFAVATASCNNASDIPVQGACFTTAGTVAERPINWDDPNSNSAWECSGSRSGFLTVTATIICYE